MMLLIPNHACSAVSPDFLIFEETWFRFEVQKSLMNTALVTRFFGMLSPKLSEIPVFDVLVSFTQLGKEKAS